jgi:hypothetical protein
MKRLLWPLAVLVVPAVLAAAGLFLIHTPVPAPAAPSDTTATLQPTVSPSPAPTVTASGSPRPTPRQAARHRHHHAGPWAVVSAYYRAIDARNYAKAWALISSGLATGQTYQEFVSGYACTGAEKATKLSQSGHQVSFNLTVVNGCAAATQHYTGTDTVLGGKIVAADVTRTG